MPIITLTTDFGTTDSYVAQMKGVILGIAPDATLVDITHQVPPQDIVAGSAILADAVGAFPPDTIHLVVVDPGVGSERRPVAVETTSRGERLGPRFVAPDNGVLTGALQHFPLRRAVRLAERRFWRTDVSHTFHGRDLFAPVAAHLSRGIELAEFGPPLDWELILLPVDRPVVEGDEIRGHIARTDSFGNLITNIDASLIPEAVRRGSPSNSACSASTASRGFTAKSSRANFWPSSAARAAWKSPSATATPAKSSRPGRGTK